MIFVFARFVQKIVAVRTVRTDFAVLCLFGGVFCPEKVGLCNIVPGVKSPLNAMFQHTNTLTPQQRPRRKLLSCEFRMPIANRQHASIWVSKSRTPNIFMPSAETAYSSLTTPMWRKLRVSTRGLNDFVVRDRPVGSGCLGNENLRQLCPPHFGQRTGDKRACAHNNVLSLFAWFLRRIAGSRPTCNGLITDSWLVPTAMRLGRLTPDEWRQSTTFQV